MYIYIYVSRFIRPHSFQLPLERPSHLSRAITVNKYIYLYIRVYISIHFVYMFIYDIYTYINIYIYI